MDDLQSGTILDGRYEIISVIGEGSTGLPCKARHQLMSKLVAIKTLRSLLLPDEEAPKGFLNEAKAISMLDHRNIVKVHDFGISSSRTAYIVMDFVNGISLAELIENEGHLPSHRTVNIFIQICDGLEHAHKLGLIHCDIKPRNILLEIVDGVETVKLTDFGMVRFLPESGKTAQVLTQTGTLRANPQYMSPEQFLGREVDARSDIYSTGCAMYESLCGKPPFESPEMMHLMEKQLTCSPAPIRSVSASIKVPDALEAVLMKALEKNPDKRFQSAAELRAALLSFHEPGHEKNFARRQSHSLIVQQLGWLAILLIVAGSCWLSFFPSGQVNFLQFCLRYQEQTGQPTEKIEQTLSQLAKKYEEQGDLEAASVVVGKLSGLMLKRSGNLSESTIAPCVALINNALRAGNTGLANKHSHSLALIFTETLHPQNLVMAKRNRLLIEQILPDIAKALNKDDFELAVCYFDLGFLHQGNNELRVSERYFKRSAEVCGDGRGDKFDRFQSQTLLALATTQLALGEDSDSHETLRHFLALSSELPDKDLTIGLGLLAYGNYCGLLAKFDEAIHWHKISLDYLQKSKDPAQITKALSAQGKTYERCGMHEKAIGSFVQAVRIQEENEQQSTREYKHNLQEIAKEYAVLGKFGEADMWTRRAASSR